MMKSTASPSAAEIAWPWRAGPASSAPGDSANRCRRRALLQAAAAAAAAILASWVWHKAWLGAALFALSALLAAAGFLAPRLSGALDRASRRFGRFVGLGLTWLLLAPFYFLCFAPGRLALRLLGRDPLARRPDPARESYWSDCRPPAAARPYTRPYS